MQIVFLQKIFALVKVNYFFKTSNIKATKIFF